MEDNKTISTLDSNSFLKLSKLDLKDRAEQAVQAVKDGWVDAIEASIMIKKTEQVLDYMKEEIKPLALSKMVEKSNSLYGVDITKSMLGVKYDYSVCQDPIWDELNAEKVALDKKLKAREAFLKTLTEAKQELIEETGEVVKIFPPIKTGTEGLTLKVK